MLLWRVEAERHLKEALDGIGAQLYGGRWNHPKTPLVYLSTSLGLAALEKFVHITQVPHIGGLRAVAIEVSDGFVSKAARPHPLPKGWRSPEPGTASMDWGSAWAGAKETLAASVPSALLPLDLFAGSNEYNVLLNPLHPRFARSVKVAAELPFAFDPRMYKT